MSGFGFSEEQEMFRQTVRRFVGREVMPRCKELMNADRWPPELMRKLSDLGLIGLNVPAEYGGQPTDWVTVGVAAEELGRGNAVLGQVAIGGLLMYTILLPAAEELRQRWLPPVVRGEISQALCITEPDCGSDAAAIGTRAVRDGDDYIINGEKTSITNGYFAEVAQVFAKTDPEKGARGVSCFLVPLDQPGVSRSRFDDMGWRATARASITFDDVRVPASQRLGEEGQGFYIVMKEFDFIRVSLALGVLGSAEASLEDAMSYAKQRTAFGKPLARFEGVSFKLAEHATRLLAAKLLCYHALWLRDQGLPHVKESAMCKWWGPRVAVDCIHDCLLVYGHVGYSSEYPIEHRLRDAIGFEMADGTANVMKIIIARELMGRESLPY